jgi:hypothetical protein
LPHKIDTIYISYDSTFPKVDTVYIHDTIVSTVYKPKNKHKYKSIPYIKYKYRSGYVTNTIPKNDIFLSNHNDSWEVVKKASTIEISDTLGGGTYSVTEIGDIQDENVELNYSIDNKIQIGWNGKKWVMCGMDGWGDCSIHLYHKSLREILDSIKSK